MGPGLNTEALGKEGSVLILTQSVKHFPREPEPKLCTCYTERAKSLGTTLQPEVERIYCGKT